ncbi:ead/Ea22-like family protein [Klebsiella pneumoniae]
MTDITELAQSLKAAANKAGADDWQAKKISGEFYVIRKGSYSSKCGYRTYQPIAEIDHKSTRDYVAIASPANILALVEALEKAQAQSSKWLEAYHKAVSIGARYEERIAELESRTVKLPEPEQWDITQVLLCKKKVVAAIRAAGIKVEAE